MAFLTNSFLLTLCVPAEDGAAPVEPRDNSVENVLRGLRNGPRAPFRAHRAGRATACRSRNEERLERPAAPRRAMRKREAS